MDKPDATDEALHRLIATERDSRKDASSGLFFVCFFFYLLRITAEGNSLIGFQDWRNGGKQKLTLISGVDRGHVTWITGSDCLV